VVASLRASPRDISKYVVVKELRKNFVNKKNFNHEENFADKPWVTKTPYDIRDAALNDVVKAYTSNFAKRITISLFISRKRKHQVIQLQSMLKITYQRGVIFPTSLGKEPIKSAEQLPDKLEYDARLVKKTYWPFLPLHSKKTRQIQWTVTKQGHCFSSWGQNLLYWI
jgi:hypothetical protein